MNEKLKGKIIIRHALCWAVAMIIPPIVMVILDGFDKHTPTRVALGSSICIMLLYPISNAFLATGLAEATKTEAPQAENDQ